MAISSDQEALKLDSSHQPSLRRRLPPDSSMMTTDSGDDSCAVTSSDADTIDRTEGNVKEEEKNKTSSVSNGGGGDYGVAFKFVYRASAPAHWRVKESPLSSDSIFKQSHAGLFNLCIVVLIAFNSRLIIENLMKYGLLIQAGFWFSSKSLKDWPLFMCCLSLPVFPLCAFMVEKLAWRKLIPDSIAFCIWSLVSFNKLRS